MVVRLFVKAGLARIFRRWERLPLLGLVFVLVFALVFLLYQGQLLNGVQTSSQCEIGQVGDVLYQDVLRNYSRYVRQAPKLLPNAELYILIVANNQDHANRKVILDTWASPKHSKWVKTGRAQIIFLYGKVKKTSSVNMKENILEIDVEEKYGNLLLKEIVAYRWLTEQTKTGHVLKIDGSDTVVDVDLLADILNTTRGNKEIAVHCATWKSVHPIRDECNRWYVPYSAVKEDYFPDYCGGPAYAMSVGTLSKIVQQAYNHKPIVVEDAFFTGILAKQAGVALKDQAEIFSSHGCLVHFYHKIGYWLVGADLSKDHRLTCNSAGKKITAVINSHNCKNKTLSYLWNVLKTGECDEYL
ncbi:unnamed protein product, partial [Mesorhabditis spiculigera]